MHRSRLKIVFLVVGSAATILTTCFAARAQNPSETTPPEHKRTDPQEATEPQPAAPQKQPTAAEAMPADKYNYRPAQGDYGGVFPGYGPKELRTFAEQVKHVACANFGFSAELDGKTPPPDCDKGGPSPAKTREELIVYLHDSFNALKKSIGAMTTKNMFDPIEGPYAGPETRLGIGSVAIWHVADHYGQLVLYMRLNGIVPPASRPKPPELKD